MFESGFLGTKALLYMDLITIYFAILPFLMGSAIFMAIKKKYKLHYKMQLSIFAITLIVVAIFEVGVRISGGFSAFMEHSNANYSYMLIFLVVHVLVAILSVALYSMLIYNSTREYIFKKEPFALNHKKMGQVVFFGMTFTSIMGILIYYFLFMY
jgi:putative membrane protein